MALFSSPFVRETYLPAGAPEAFAALRVFLGTSAWSTGSVDDFAMSATFKTGITAMTYGMTGSVQVIPNREGSTLSVSVTPKIGAQFRNAANQQRIADELFSGVSQQIQASRAASAE
jgi:hypothetical protein